MAKARERFEGELQESLDDTIDNYPKGAVYYQMRESFDRAIATTALRRAGSGKRAAQHLGVNYRTFRKMLGK